MKQKETLGGHVFALFMCALFLLWFGSILDMVGMAILYLTDIGAFAERVVFGLRATDVISFGGMAFIVTTILLGMIGFALMGSPTVTTITTTTTTYE